MTLAHLRGGVNNFMARRNKTFTNSQQEPDIRPVLPRTEAQRAYVEAIRTKPITICTAPAGTGKTLLAMHEAVQALQRREVSQVFYVKPNVGLQYEKGIGFMPGEMDEKLAPLLASAKDNMQQFLSAGKMQYLLDKKLVEPLLAEFCRGRNLDWTFLIIDEAQNCHLSVLTTLLTRITGRSKCVIIGDLAQSDTKAQPSVQHLASKLQHLDFVAQVKMTYDDCQRAPWMRQLLKALD